MKTYRKKLLARYHIICRQMGMTESERQAHLEESYGVSSSRELTDRQLIDAIDTLQRVQQSEVNTWRRRVMAAIGAYLRNMHIRDNAEIIKAIACRAAHTDNFNRIPLSKLRAIYNEFRKQNKTYEECRNLKALIENELSTLN